ncbi:MAG: transcriptional regulator AbrB family [Cenarchaeum symbiont of Oopsacas minuta]|nr:transcriptional regulator AbrB family [Cenarchaeum symbiont of Oopsacas minuta]
MGKALGSSKITTRYQVTIPESARDVLNVKSGDNLVFVLDGKRIYVSADI